MMDRLEQDLHRVLRDPPSTPTPVTDIVDRVHGGMATRLIRRRTVAALAVALAVAVVASAPIIVGLRPPAVQQPGPTATSNAVPWLDAPVLTPTPSPSVNRPSRPPARPCHGTDLRLSGVDVEGAGGHTGYFVRVENTSPSRCTLAGSVDLTGIDGHGRRVAIPTEDGTFFDNDDSQERPATIDPGETAMVTIETSLSCDGGAPASTTSYRLVLMRLPDSTIYSLADRLDSSCPVSAGTWYRPVPEPEGPGEPWAKLVAHLSGVPDTVHAGETISFVVELVNREPASIGFSPCPAYRQGVGRVLNSYWLNCAAAPVIPALGSVRFAMRLTVDINEPLGPAKMNWFLVASTAGASTTVTVVR